MKVEENIYQLKSGKPFSIRDIDTLYYACDFIHSDRSFFMEKETFDVFLKTGLVTTFQQVSNF